MKHSDAASADRYDPNEISTYTDPEKVRLLTPANQMVATINLAMSGQLVGGDYVRTMEAIMKEAGYEIVIDGQFSAGELQAMEHFKRQLEDADFKETANEMLALIVGSPEEGKLQIPALAALLNPHLNRAEAEAPARRQTIVSDPF